MSKNLRSKARDIGRRAAGGLKGPVMAFGGGAGFAAVNHYLLSDVEFIKDNWWARGGIGAVLGFLLRRVLPASMRDPVGYGMLGAGGFLLASDWLADDGGGSEAGAVWPPYWHGYGAAPGDAGAVYFPANARGATLPDASGFQPAEANSAAGMGVPFYR